MSSERHRPLRVGTRSGPLALAQAGRIARQLSEPCGRLAVLVVTAALDGSTVIPAELVGAAGDGEALGRRLAQALLQDGEAELLDWCRCSPMMADRAPQRVFLLAAMQFHRMPGTMSACRYGAC